MGDPTITRHDDGTLTVGWPDPPLRTYEVAHEALRFLVDDYNEVVERVATLERALSDSTRRELLLDKRRAALEREIESWWRDLNPDEASESDIQLAALLDASQDQERDRD